jgi:hypothetical protein
VDGYRYKYFEIFQIFFNIIFTKFFYSFCDQILELLPFCTVPYG